MNPGVVRQATPGITCRARTPTDTRATTAKTVPGAVCPANLRLNVLRHYRHCAAHAAGTGAEVRADVAAVEHLTGHVRMQRLMLCMP